MALQQALAALLLSGPSHGYQLMATLQAELGPLWETRSSRVYLTLARMEREGLVTSSRIRQDSRPDRHVLRLTQRGRGIAEQWLEGLGPADETVVRLAVARLVIPDRFEALAAEIASQRAASLQRLRELRRQATEGFQPEALDAEIARAQSDLRWLALVRERHVEIVARPTAKRRSGIASAERTG
ncbi:MAG: PadR family transcriptional regulator [Candidatus Dormibacteraceae bacterium]